MPTGDNFELTSGYLYCDGVMVGNGSIDNITTVNVVVEECEVEPITFTRDKEMEFGGEFNFVFPNKYNKKTLDFCRRCFGIDLLTRKFPKKKNRRFIRIKRRVREWRQKITHGKGWTI